MGSRLSLAELVPSELFVTRAAMYEINRNRMISDSDLIIRIRAGNPAGAAVLVHRYYEEYRHFIYGGRYSCRCR